MKTATTTETTADQENLDRAIDRPSNKIRQDGPISLLSVLQNSGSRHTNVVLRSHASSAEWDWSIDLRKRLYGDDSDGQDEASSASRLVLNTSSGRCLEQSLAEPGKKNLHELLASPALVPRNSRDEQTSLDVTVVGGHTAQQPSPCNNPGHYVNSAIECTTRTLSQNFEEENRLLFGETDGQTDQQPKENDETCMNDHLVRVMVRVRPAQEHLGHVKIVSSKKIRTETSEYEFAAILPPETSQSQMYDATLRPYFSGLLKGESAMLFCYGDTDTGKTYTVMGDLLAVDDAAAAWGLVPRVLHELLDHCGAVGLASFEVYNDGKSEAIRDLLPSGTSSGKDDFSLLQSVSEHQVTSEAALMTLLKQSTNARKVCNGGDASGRAHAVMRITLPKNTPTDPPTYLWIIDLARSAMVRSNLTLRVLQRCLRDLNEGKKSPPFHRSMLTRILGHHWRSKNASRTTMIVNIGDGGLRANQSEIDLDRASMAAKAVMTALPVHRNELQGARRDSEEQSCVPKMSPPVRSSDDQDRLKELQDDPTQKKIADRIACLNGGVQDDATLKNKPVSTVPLQDGVHGDLTRTKNADPLVAAPLTREVHDDENSDPPAPLLLKDGVQDARILMRNADPFAPLPLKGRAQDDPTRTKNADRLVPRALKGGVRSREPAQEENLKQEQDFRSGLPFGMVFGQGPGLHGAIATIVLAVLNNKRR
jgi:hypothetical protein